MVILPALTAGLTALRADVPLADDLLLYLVALVGIAFVGGFWPAVTAAVAASLLLNWYFTPPLHTGRSSGRRTCSRCCSSSPSRCR